NIVSADFFGISFTQYAKVMASVTLVSVTSSLAVLLLYFWKNIPTHYDIDQLRKPKEAIYDHATFRAGWAILPALLVGFFSLESLDIPVSVVAITGALTLYVVARRSHKIDTHKVLINAPWAIVVFSLGMY